MKSRLDTGERLPDRVGLYRNNWHKWGLAASELCDCGKRQTMGHIVDSSMMVWRDSTRLMMTQSTGWKSRRQQHSPEI